MKKLLSILGAVGLTATGASGVIACNYGKPKPIKQPAPLVKPQPKPVQPQKPITKKDIEESIKNDPDKDKNNLFQISVPSELFVKNPQEVQESELKSIFNEEILKSGKKINNNITKNDFEIYICNVGTLDVDGQLMLENAPYDLTTNKFLKIVWFVKNKKFGDEFNNNYLNNIVTLPIAKTK